MAGPEDRAAVGTADKELEGACGLKSHPRFSLGEAKQ